MLIIIIIIIVSVTSEANRSMALTECEYHEFRCAKQTWQPGRDKHSVECPIINHY